MTERNLARAMGDEEIQEAAYVDYAAGMKIAAMAEKYGVHVRTIERWRKVKEWRTRLSHDKLEALKTQRQLADEQLTENMPKVMREAIRLALHAESESVRLNACKYLLGTMGYSPEASEQWLKAMEAKVAQMDEETQGERAATSPEGLSALFSEAAGYEFPVQAPNGPESGETEVWEGGEEVWDDEAR